MFNNIDMEQCGGTNGTSKLSPLGESDNIIEVSLAKKKICGHIQKVSLKNRVKDVADYIRLKYPSIINESVKMSDPRIIDICKEVFKTKNIKKLSKDVVKALSASNSTLCKLIKGTTENNIPTNINCLIPYKNELVLRPYRAVNEICSLKKITKSKKNIMRLLRKSERSHQINEEISKSVNCGEGVHTFLPVHISESNVDNNLDVCDRVVEIGQHSNISCKSNKLGFHDNYEKLTVNNSGKNPYENENITVLTSCNRESDTIDTSSNEILKRDVRRKLDFKVHCDTESETSKCTVIKQRNETFEIDDGVCKLDWTSDDLNNSFLRCGEIQTIEETNDSLVANCSNIITSTPIRLEVDISRQQAFTHSPQAVNFSYHKSYVDGNNCSPMKSIVLPNEAEVIDAVTPIKLPGTIVACSTPEADAKALPKNSKNIFPLTIRGDLENKKEKRYNFSYLNTIEGTFELSICEWNELEKLSNEHGRMSLDLRNMLIRDKFVTVNNSCVLSIKNVNKNSSGEFTSIYGYCRHNTCKSFKFDFEKKN
ncbi:unnamed protein product [Macrosiphum euphorbiae]|uniref:Uncharacterized protein n=1 Tax=Macrosiphum euphorbiae TaxID=13131 RepID=A0AAV0XU40_9HEMI|nr:unnamed protein product [Macrosiphum euphorbiae]